MISQDVLQRISHMFCGDEEGYFSYKTGPKLVDFLIHTSIRMMNMYKDFLHGGHMYMINYQFYLLMEHLIIFEFSA